MGKKVKKSRSIGRRAATQPVRAVPKSKAINPVVIGIVTFTMILVLIVTVAPQATSGTGSSGRPSGATQTIDNTQQQRIANLEEALKADPNNLGVLVELGNTYYDSGQFAKAVDRYIQALDIDPNNTNVRVDLGTSYLSLGMVSQAIKEYRKALEIDPQKPEAHLNLGNALVSDVTPNVDEAISEWQKAVQFAGDNKDVAKKAQDQLNKYKR